MKKTLLILLGCIILAFVPFVLFYVFEYYNWRKP